MKDKAIVGLMNWKESNLNADLPLLQKKIKNLNNDLKENLMIMISGEFNAGKSTFINALLGEKVLTTDITPATAIITKLTYGTEKKVIAHYIDDSEEEYELSWIEQLTAEREGAGKEIRNRLAYVEYQLPNELLKSYTLIDSPGLTALHEHHSKVTESFMERADIAIWLFNALSVGTATELNWLKKVHSLEVPIYGVVNAIDRIEDEDLDTFLEYNERRLQPYITKLYGVSARDILSGKLNNDPIKIEWGNAQALEELFKQFDPVQLRKMEGFYRKVKTPLEEQYNLLREKKMTFEFVGKTSKLRSFQTYIYPKFLEEAQYLDMVRQDGSAIYNEWKQLIEKYRRSKDLTDHIVYNLKDSKQLIKQWEHELKPKLDISQTKYNTLLKEWKELKGSYEKIGSDWGKLESSNTKIFKKSIVARREKRYNLLVREWHKRHDICMEENKEIVKIVEAFNGEVERAVIQEVSHYQKEVNNYSKRIESCKTLATKEFGEMKISTIQQLREHLINVEALRYQTLPYFKTGVTSLTSLRSYQQVNSLSARIENLYANFNYLDFLNNFEMLQTYEVPQNVEPLSFKAIPINEYRSYPLRKLPFSKVSLEYTSQKVRVINATWLSVLFFLLGGMIFYPVDNSSQSTDQGTFYESEEALGVDDESDYELKEVSGDELEESAFAEENEGIVQNANSDDEVEETVVEEPIVEEPVYLVEEYVIQDFINTYRADYEEALNYEDFSSAAEYLNKQQPIYGNMLEYVDSIKGEGLTFDFLNSTVTSIEEVGLNRYSVMVEEEFNLSDSDDGRKSYNERFKQYILSVVSDNVFLIEDITTLDKLTEIIQVSAEEGYDETSEEPEGEFLYTEETSGLVTEEEVSRMMEQYYMDLEIAFNDNGFSYIENYYAYDGEEYGPTAAYIAKAHKKNMVMKNHYISVENVEVYDANHYLATLSLEDEYHYQDGDGDIKKIRANYLIRVTSNGEMKIEEIPSVEILEKIEF